VRRGTQPALPQEGDVVAGKYRVERVVGEGAMGIVYAAHHLVLDQRVALKFLFVDSTEAGGETVERFVREAQAAARLRSEHVVRVTDAGSSDAGFPFLVMEYLEGCDLAELLKVDGPLPPAEVADYVLQVLAALAEAHAAGIVHRDLKPANLFVADRGDHSPVIKILDFGISKQRSERAQWRELTGKAVLGTPAYISPEQLRSSKSVDPRADIWSLGVAMYELLSGTLPFDGETPGELFAAILERTPVPLRARKPELPDAWDGLLARCLKRDPQERFAHVGALAEALAPLGSGRWAHLLPAIEEALTRSVRSLPQANAALVQAAVQAAIASLPPPTSTSTAAASAPRAPLSTIATDKTILALVVPKAAAERRRATGRLPAMLAAAGLALVACAGLAVFARSAPRSPVVAANAVERSEAPPLPAPAVPPPVLSEQAGEPAASAADPALSASSTSAPAAAPTPSKRRATPSRKTSDPKARPDARPNFLRSWR